jgi:hypothetical protein
MDPDLYVKAKAGTIVWDEVKGPLGFTVTPDENERHRVEHAAQHWEFRTAPKLTTVTLIDLARGFGNITSKGTKSYPSWPNGVMDLGPGLALPLWLTCGSQVDVKIDSFDSIDPSGMDRNRHHSITSSARPSSGSDTVSPSALAVLRLMIISTLVDCCTGSSPGFSPLRIRPA